jgi:very-short-patch-repair endonuclease
VKQTNAIAKPLRKNLTDSGRKLWKSLRAKQFDGWLRKQGFKVLRFWDDEVLTNTPGVIEFIRESVTPSLHPSHQEAGS